MPAPLHTLGVDLETYSPINIAKAGLFKYVMSPDFQLLLFGYAVDGVLRETVDLTVPGARIPGNVMAMLFDPAVLKTAYNAAFEWFCLCKYFGMLNRPEDTGPASWLPQWRCTMVHGQYLGYPAGLDMLGKALGLPQDKRKLSCGKALIKYFCTPCAPTKSNGGRTRNLPRHDPAKWQLFKEYNAQDVVAEQAIAQALDTFPVPESIWRQWRLDQAINLRGVMVDIPLMDGALYCGQTVRDDLIGEAARLSGLGNPNSVAQLTRWLEAETGEELADLRKDTVKDLLAKGVPSDAATRVLEIRQELGKTSTKKYNALEACVCADGRVRGLLQFYGANRTGREAGRLVQVQNLPRDTVPAERLARQLVKDKALDALKAVYGSVPATLAALIRTVFIAAPGMLFIDADFSAIEARVIAWLANEKWVLEVFRTHGKIYEAAASQMFNVPLELIKKGNPAYEYRKKGKVATLALGYQGGPGALVNMGAIRSGLTEEELPDIVQRWRKANPSIVKFWYAVEAAAMDAVVSGKATQVGQIIIAREIGASGLDFMTVALPAGRKLYYARPHIGTNRFGRPGICYWGMDQASHKWAEVETYGGKLVENITQAVARDCLFFAMENLAAAGYNIVFDIHDEVVLEAPAAQADLGRVVRIMSQPVPWAPGLPLNADGWVGSYFKKD